MLNSGIEGEDIGVSSILASFASFASEVEIFRRPRGLSHHSLHFMSYCKHYVAMIIERLVGGNFEVYQCLGACEESESNVRQFVCFELELH